eukprot:TRINITY_DN112_c0_g1_i2.p1 TRINITY_DN112_c0_g1~~TRINITY_DN112_c0_g1_i2.p1  ORF type:complete len:334 (-),score=0.91 TRINITY_DN112_c0_g1_i2:86-1087(-)
MHIRCLSNIPSPEPELTENHPQLAARKNFLKKESRSFKIRKGSKDLRASFFNTGDNKDAVTCLTKVIDPIRRNGRTDGNLNTLTLQSKPFSLFNTKPSLTKDQSEIKGQKLRKWILDKYESKATSLASSLSNDTHEICDLFEGFFADLSQCMPDYVELFNRMKDLATTLKREEDNTSKICIKKGRVLRNCTSSCGENPLLTQGPAEPNVKSPKHGAKRSVDLDKVKPKLILKNNIRNERRLGVFKCPMAFVKSLSPVAKGTTNVPKLNLDKLKKISCKNYDDEFNEKFDEFSDSWKRDVKDGRASYEQRIKFFLQYSLYQYFHLNNDTVHQVS